MQFAHYEPVPQAISEEIAAKAVGAHGIIIEVHPNPAEAKSDKEQALTFEDFRAIMGDLREIPHGRP